MNPYILPGISITTNTIIDRVSSAWSLGDGEIFTKTRRRNIVDARKIATLLIREVCKSTMQSIGRTFHQSHDTILYSTRMAVILIQQDKVIRDRFIHICKSLCVHPDTVNEILKRK